MTENEYKRLMEIVFDDCMITKEDADAITTIFEEIQQYRAIGTVEELKTAMKYVSLAKKHGTVGKAIDACAEYESIGTIDEFKAFKLGRLGNKGFITIGQTIEEFKEEIRAKAIDEFADRMISMMPGHKQDILLIAEQLKGVQE